MAEGYHELHMMPVCNT